MPQVSNEDLRKQDRFHPDYDKISTRKYAHMFGSDQTRFHQGAACAHEDVTETKLQMGGFSCL